VSIRLRTFVAKGHGQLVGYAFLEDYRYVTSHTLHLVMDAIMAADDAARQRQNAAIRVAA
jgi:hypothetical protein